MNDRMKGYVFGWVVGTVMTVAGFLFARLFS